MRDHFHNTVMPSVLNVANGRHGCNADTRVTKLYIKHFGCRRRGVFGKMLFQVMSASCYIQCCRRTWHKCYRYPNGVQPSVVDSSELEHSSSPGETFFVQISNSCRQGVVMGQNHQFRRSISHALNAHFFVGRYTKSALVTVDASSTRRRNAEQVARGRTGSFRRSARGRCGHSHQHQVDRVLVPRSFGGGFSISLASSSWQVGKAVVALVGRASSSWDSRVGTANQFAAGCAHGQAPQHVGVDTTADRNRIACRATVEPSPSHGEEPQPLSFSCG